MVKNFNYFLLSLAILISCSEDDISEDMDNQIVPIMSISVDPQQTDANITTGLGTQFAYVPISADDRTNKLLIFIPGTFSNPETYRKIIETAAEYGYYSFGIDYQNNRTIGAYCRNSSDPMCTFNVLLEFFEGNDVSTEVNVGSSNSFTNRITKMIQYLDAQNSDQNWGQFLDSTNGINWNMISVAGHSQGSGHTLFISKQVELFRAGLFSGPNGLELDNGALPDWVSTPGETLNINIYGFSNTNDGLAPFNSVSNTWQQIGLSGTAINVDQTSDFNNSNRLITSVEPDPILGSASPTHGSTAVDLATPLDAEGRPVFENVWRYMCFPE